MLWMFKRVYADLLRIPGDQIDLIPKYQCFDVFLVKLRNDSWRKIQRSSTMVGIVDAYAYNGPAYKHNESKGIVEL